MGFNFDEIQVDMPAGVRRLPIYLLLDISGSMDGAAIAAVQRGVEQCIQEVQGDQFARETVHFGIITFSDDADLITGGLVPANQVPMPYLTAGGMTALGKAFRVLGQSLDRDVKRSVQGGAKGDWKPLVFILTDGRPSDDWQTPRNELLNRRRDQSRTYNVITVGCGPDVDDRTLKAIALDPNATFRMDKADASFSSFFKWVSTTASRVAEGVSRPGGAGESPVQMPNPQDAGLVYIP